MKYRTKEDIEAAKEMVSPPGETLLDTMNAVGIKQPELADRMGRPLKTINEIINGKAAITPETAIQLERVLGVEADFWMQREQNYRLELAAIADSEKLLEAEKWAHDFPVHQMVKYGWIENTDDDLAMINNILSYFSVANTEAFHNFYGKQLTEYLHSSFRLQADHTIALATWMRSADLIAQKTTLNEFSKSDFSEALKEILLLTVMNNLEEMISRMKEIAKEAGVLVVFSPEIKGNKLLGGARWVHNKPVIQMSNSYSGLGQFWNTFYHEAGHIMKHGKKDIFIDDNSFVHARKEKEAEANSYAASFLCREELEEEISGIKDINANMIHSISKKMNINSAIVSHCLYANRKISSAMNNKFEKSFVVVE